MRSFLVTSDLAILQCHCSGGQSIGNTWEQNIPDSDSCPVMLQYIPGVHGKQAVSFVIRWLGWNVPSSQGVG